MSEKKLYYPPRSFDSDLLSFSNMASEQRWIFTGVDFKQLAKDAEEQRKARTEFELLEARYLKAKEEFGMGQELRHERFTAALNAARGAFKNDRATMALLDTFKRPATRSAKKDEKKGEKKDDKKEEKKSETKDEASAA